MACACCGEESPQLREALPGQDHDLLVVGTQIQLGKGEILDAIPIEIAARKRGGVHLITDRGAVPGDLIPIETGSDREVDRQVRILIHEGEVRDPVPIMVCGGHDEGVVGLRETGHQQAMVREAARIDEPTTEGEEARDSAGEDLIDAVAIPVGDEPGHTAEDLPPST